MVQIMKLLIRIYIFFLIRFMLPRKWTCRVQLHSKKEVVLKDSLYDCVAGRKHKRKCCDHYKVENAGNRRRILFKVIKVLNVDKF